MRREFLIIKVVSGGQTGADRAALDGAIEADCPHGGWIPLGRRTEAGTLPACYLLREMATKSYPKRTEQNVIDSDGTLIVSHGGLTGGSLLTRQLAEKHGRPVLHLDFQLMGNEDALDEARQWLRQHGIAVLNVAGPRASSDPDIYPKVKKLVIELLNLRQKC